MRAVIQRVVRASVTVDSETVGSIGRGLCILVGLNREDGPDDVEYIIRKILNTRLFSSQEGKKWDKSVKGNTLDFHVAMSPDKAKPFYEEFLEKMKTAYEPDKIEDGRFGAMMEVNIVNDGPVTILLDSKRRD